MITIAQNINSSSYAFFMHRCVWKKNLDAKGPSLTPLLPITIRLHYELLCQTFWLLFLFKKY